MSEQAATVSPVARGRTYLPGKVRAAAAAGCCLLTVAGLAWIVWPHERAERSGSGNNGSWSMGQAFPDRPIIPAVARVPEPPKQADPVPTRVEAVPVPIPAATRVMGFWQDDQAAQQAAQRAAQHATGHTGGDGSVGFENGVATPSPGGGSEYAQRMQTTQFGDTTPTPPRFHVQYTIAEGTSFPCTVREPISSTLPGGLKCTVDENVWSMDGGTILLPLGTQVALQIERGLTNGEERLWINAKRAQTPKPDQQVIPIESPVSDELGQSGVPGDVNTHFGKRLLGAAAFSLLDIATSAISGAAGGGHGNTNINLGSVGSQAQSLGAMEFQRNANIPPVLFRAQGMTVTIKTSHYIDLVHYYRNVVR